MSNYIVSKGLGDALLIPEGYGAVTNPAILSPSIIAFSQGGLRISLRKFRTGAMFYFEDGDNAIQYFFPLTANQLAGIDWTLCKVTRSGSNLIVSLDKNNAVTIPLSLVKSYGGVVELMNQNNGALFDVRVVPQSVPQEAFSYYQDDLSENSGNALLPLR